MLIFQHIKRIIHKESWCQIWDHLVVRKLRFNQGNISLKVGSNLARFEPTHCCQESVPSCVRVQLWFSLTFRGNLHLFGANLDDPSLVFCLLFLTPSLHSLQNLSSCPVLELVSRSQMGSMSSRSRPGAPPRCLRAAAGLFGRCDLCYSPWLVWGRSFLKAALVSQSAPAGGRAASLTLAQHPRLCDARPSSAARDRF